MSGDINFGVRFTANGDQLVGATKESTAAVDGLNSSMQRAKTVAESLGITEAELAARLQKNAGASEAYMQRVRDQAAAHKQAAEQVYVVNESYLKNAEAAGKGTEAVKTNSTAVRESLVLMREASRGNFTRMAGSASILANAMGLMPMLLNPVTIALGAVAAAGVAMGVAFENGRAEVARMDSALGSTSNYAGMTRGSMRELAASVSDAGNITLSTGKEIVTQLVASGQIGAGAIKNIAGIAEEYARATGQDVAKLTPELVKMFADPARGADELNKSMHFLTVAETEHIATLQRQGELGQAQLVLSEALKQHLAENTLEISNQGGVLDTVSKAWSKFWDAAQGVGRPETLQDKLRKAKENLASQDNLHHMGLPSDQGNAQLIIDNINREIAAEKQLSDAKAETAKKNQLDAKIQDEVHKGKSYQIQELNDSIALLQKGEQTNAVLEREKEIREQIANLKKPTPVKVDPVTASYNRLMKEFSDFALEAQGRTENLTRAQIKLNEAKAGANWKSFGHKRQNDIIAGASAADDQEKSQKITKESNNAQEESARIIAKVTAADSERIAQLQFKNSLIGKSALEVQMLTEANKIDLAVQRQIQALDLNPNFATRDRGDGKAFNPQVDTAYKSAVDVIKQKADATKAASEVEIQAHDAANRSWDVGGTAAIHAYMDNVNNAGRQSAQIFSTTFKSAEDTLAKFYQTGKLGARDFVNVISGELARLAAQKTMSGLGDIFSSVGGSGSGAGGISGIASIASMFGFANGGIMTPSGPLPLKAYANGGIANSPQLTLFGEGRTPEAYVPLPDGRSIPVSLTGGTSSSASSGSSTGGITINVIMNTATGGTTSQASGASSGGTAAYTQLGNTIAQAVRAQIVQEQRQGGLLAPQAA